MDYYYKIFQDYGIIAAPLTNMLKNKSFIWMDEALAAFNRLKETVTTEPIPGLLHLKSYIVELDASKFIIGLVFPQFG